MSDPILTAAETRAAESRAFDSGVDPLALMERAGGSVAEIVAARFDPQPLLIACGPGNNGGDGYVVARHLREAGWDVRVAALADPATDSAKAMRARWDGPVEPLPADPSPFVIDALFGIGSRGLSADIARWLDAAPTLIAIDQPSGLDTDTGAPRGRTRPATLTVALGAWKPLHALPPGAALCGETVLAPLDLPLPPHPRLVRIAPPRLTPPDHASNKYSRGKVVVVAGAMPGAAHLAAVAAMRSGAGYVELAGDAIPFGTPYALVRRDWSEALLSDARVGAVVIGPGLDDGKDARDRVAAVVASDRPAVLDAGALSLIDLPLARAAPTILTPHEGEFARLFGPVGDDPLAAVRAAAERAGAIVLLKGATTIVAAPGGRAAIAPLASPWLATAGTGDVLAGVIGTMLAQREAHGMDAFAAVQAAIWLHARAAERAGPALIADDLLFALKTVIAKA